MILHEQLAITLIFFAIIVNNFIMWNLYSASKIISER